MPQFVVWAVRGSSSETSQRRRAASTSRTARVAAGPLVASARAVATPIPDAAPVTMTVRSGQVDAVATPAAVMPQSLGLLGADQVGAQPGCGSDDGESRDDDRAEQRREYHGDDAGPWCGQPRVGQ